MKDCCPGETDISAKKEKKISSNGFYKSHISFILIKSLVKIDIDICGDAGEIAGCLRILVT